MKIVDGLRPYIQDIMEEPEIAGPGFINLRFKREYLEQSIYNMAQDPERLAIPLAA
jgi:arginyl-tRNA synthetase